MGKAAGVGYRIELPEDAVYSCFLFWNNASLP